MQETTRGFKKRESTDQYSLDNIENFNTQKANDELDTIYQYIPTAAKPRTDTNPNELADKAFVNSTVQTASSFYRGVFGTWALVPTDPSGYKIDPNNNHKPTNNDYMVVTNASDYTGTETLDGTWRFKYTGVWDTNGKSGWSPEYRVNEKALTQAQINALDSGITETLRQSYDTHLSTTSGNPHAVNKTDVGLGNVDNTSDMDKPISTAQLTKFDTKVDKSSLVNITKILPVDALPETTESTTLYLIKENT